MNLDELRQQNCENENTLPQDIQKEYEDMILYLMSFNLKEEEVEKIREDIFYMVSNGLSDGQSFHDIIGDDYKIFINEIVEVSDQDKSIQVGAYPVLMYMIYILISHIINVVLHSADIWTIPLSVADIVMLVLLYFSVTPIIHLIVNPYLRKEIKKATLYLFVFFVSIIVIHIGLSMIIDYTLSIPLFAFIVVGIYLHMREKKNGI